MSCTIDATTGDIGLDDFGNLSLVEKRECVRQAVTQRLRMALGEWFLNKLLGVPYENTKLNPNKFAVLNRPVDLEAIALLLDDQIATVEGVKKLLESSVSLDAETRRLRYEATIETNDGLVSVNTEASNG